MFVVYVLWSNKLKKRYIGHTKDLARRMAEHNHGYSKFTKAGSPWVLVHQEDYSSKSDAYKCERYLKTGVGRKYLVDIIDSWRGVRVV
jgi:putative endonuclease